VVLLTNSPRSSVRVEGQIAAMGASSKCYDLIVSSGDAARIAMEDGQFGKRIYHIGPERERSNFPSGMELVALEQAESIVCTGLFDDQTETPEDYRATMAYGVAKSLRLLCTNPDAVVDVGDRRSYCAGAIAEAYSAAGGESFYFGKPHPPIYGLARAKLVQLTGEPVSAESILCIGDGGATDILGAMDQKLDSVFITGGLAAHETGTTPDRGPDPEQLARFLTRARLSSRYAMGFLR
jgi:HAD superfamily hydrolase (TIGR01459 family)